MPQSGHCFTDNMYSCEVFIPKYHVCGGWGNYIVSVS